MPHKRSGIGGGKYYASCFLNARCSACSDILVWHRSQRATHPTLYGVSVAPLARAFAVALMIATDVIVARLVVSIP